MRASYNAAADICEIGKYFELSPQLRVNPYLTDVELTLLNVERFTVVGGLSNNSDLVISAGNEFFVDFFDGESWREFPFNRDFTLIGVIMAPSDETARQYYVINPRDPLSFLEAELYRIRIAIHISHSTIHFGLPLPNHVTDFSPHDLTMEFTLQHLHEEASYPEDDLEDSEYFELSPPLRVNPHLIDVEFALIDIERRAVRGRITNNSELEFWYGAEFHIDFFDGENWRVIPRDIGFGLAAYSARPGSSWENIYTVISPRSPFYLPSADLYRIRRTINISRYSPLFELPYYVTDFTPHDLVMEFEW